MLMHDAGDDDGDDEDGDDDDDDDDDDGDMFLYIWPNDYDMYVLHIHSSLQTLHGFASEDADSADDWADSTFASASELGFFGPCFTHVVSAIKHIYSSG